MVLDFMTPLLAGGFLCLTLCNSGRVAAGAANSIFRFAIDVDSFLVFSSRPDLVSALDRCVSRLRQELHAMPWTSARLRYLRRSTKPAYSVVETRGALEASSSSSPCPLLSEGAGGMRPLQEIRGAGEP